MRVFSFRLLGLFISLLIIMGVFIALLPTMMSTNWGQRQVVHWINRSIPGQIEIQHLDLRWGKGQIIQGFLLNDPKGQKVIEFDQFSTEATLWQLIKKDLCLGFVQIQNLSANIVTDENGQTNLQQALGLYSNSKSLLSSTIVLSDVNIESHLFSPDRPLSIQMKGLTRQGHLDGSFETHLFLNGLWASNWKEFKSETQKYLTIEGSKEAKIQARIVNFPVDLIDHLAAIQNPHLNGFFHSLLGDRLQLTLNKESSDKGLAFNLTLLAPLLQGDIKGMIKEDYFSLNEPAVFHWNLEPESIHFLTDNKIQLLNSSRLEMIFSDVRIPLHFFNQEGKIDPNLLEFKAKLKLPEAHLNVDPLGNVNILNLQAHLTSLQGNQQIQMELFGKAQPQNQPPFDLHFTSSIHKPSNLFQFVKQMRQSLHSNLNLSNVPLQMIPLFHKHPEWVEKVGPYANAQIEVHSNDKEEWLGTFSFQTPLFILKKAQWRLEKENTLELYIPRVTQFFDQDIAQLDNLSLKIDRQNFSLFQSNLTGQFSLLTLDGTPYFFTPFKLDPIKMDLNSSLISLQGLLEMPDLNPVLGSRMDLNLKVFFDPATEKDGYCDIVLDSTRFHLHGRFKLNHQMTIQNPLKPPTFRLTVTPESYQYFKKIFTFKDEFQIAAPFTVTGLLSKFDFPFTKSWAENGVLDFQLSTTRIQWKNSPSPLGELKGRLFTDNLKKYLNFSFQASDNKTFLSTEGSFTNLFDEKHNLHPWRKIVLKAECNGQQLTPNFLQNAFFLTPDQKQKLYGLFGESFNMSAACGLQNLNGSIQAFIRGIQGDIQLNGHITEGVLTLNQPLKMSIKMTPLFSQTFAPHIPFLNTISGAENPLTLTIEPSQFSCPLSPFQLEQLKIGKAYLNFGKLHFRNEGELSSLLSLIRPFSDQYFTIWFTPIYMELEKGILSFKRFDMLIAHAYTLANWGTLNLLTNKGNFTLGLSAQTLQYGFGVQGLDENYILPIPLSIAKGKMEIDKKRATTKLSTLVAQSSGGLKGLLGNILNIASFISDSDSDKDEPYPSPTTQPFPWQGEFESLHQHQQRTSHVAESSFQPQDQEKIEENKPKEKKKKKKKRKILDGAIEDLQDGTLQLLDQWLRI